MLFHPLWIDELSAEERSVLDPGPRSGIDLKPDVLVVGGGAMGVLTARALHRSGFGSVVLVESERIGAGPSGSAAGLLIPEAHVGLDPAPVVDLARLSLVMWKKLAGELPGIGLTELDIVALDPLSERFGPGPPLGARSLDAEEVASLVPGLSERTSGSVITGQGRLNPLRALAVIARSLPAVLTRTEVVSIRSEGERVDAVETTLGTFEPGTVIFCTGGPPKPTAAGDMPSSWVRGHMLATEPVAFRLPGMVDPVCTQLPDGRLLVGGSLDVGATSREVDISIVETMFDDLVSKLPAAREAQISHAWCCFRPLHPDHLPVIDRVPRLSNAWFTSGHYRSGVMMAPVVADALVRLVRQQDCSDLSAFKAQRFL